MLAWVGVAAGAAATIVVGLRFRPSERVMKKHGGRGILWLELAPGPERARALVGKWKDEGVAAARASIRLDWWFIAAYAVCFASLGLAIDKPVSSVLVLAGAALDVVENVGMLRVLDGQYGTQWVAFGASAAKWTTLLVLAPVAAILG